MKKRFLAIILTVCMLLMLLPVQTYAYSNAIAEETREFKDEQQNQVWSGEIADSYAGGSGTSKDPYLIATAEQLAKVAYDTNNAEELVTVCYKLLSDIYLNDTSNWESWSNDAPANTWTPIGTYESRFNGDFDGAGHIIYGVYIDNDQDYQGIFGYASAYNIHDLGNECSYICGGNYIGGIAGCVSGNVTKCYNSGIVTGTSYIGGIVGGTGKLNLESCGTVLCYNTGDISGSEYVGGIAGTSVVVESSWNIGAISGTTDVGGVLGRMTHKYGIMGGRIEKCFNAGTVTGTDDVGGVAGYTRAYSGLYSSYILYCYNIGEVIATGNRSAGIVGCPTHTAVVNSYNAGSCTMGENGQPVAAFNNKVWPETANNYFLSGSCPSDCINLWPDHVFEKNSSEMRQSDFADELNNGGSAWIQDTQGYNLGFPVLKGIDYEVYAQYVEKTDIAKGDITFDSDTYSVPVGRMVTIKAMILDVSALGKDDIFLSSSDENIVTITLGEVLIGTDNASATAMLQGIALGTATITVSTSNGCTGSVEVRVVNNANMTPDEFNSDIYRADLLTSRIDLPFYANFNNLLKGRSPSRTFLETLNSNLPLLYAKNAWNNMSNAFKIIEKPSNLYGLAFEEKDFYTAILLDILQANISNSQVSSLESSIKTVKSWIDEATTTVKLQFNIDNFEFDSNFTEKDKKNIADAYMEYFQKELKFDTWDTDHAFLGYMSIVFKYYSAIMDTVDNLEDFADQILSAYALVAMSESTKNVVQKLYDNCPLDNYSLRFALQDIVEYMNSTEEELLLTLVNDGLTIAGVRIASVLVDEFWDGLDLSCAPEVKILIALYKAEKWCFDELGGVSNIAEQCNKVVMTTDLENLMISTVKDLASDFTLAQNILSAEVFLKSIDIYFALLGKSADQAVSFVDAVDSGLLKKVANYFRPCLKNLKR